MTRFVQAEVPPQIYETGWHYLFVTVDKPPVDAWKHDHARPEGWLHPVFVWCEERYGSHYGEGNHRFWFSGQNRVLFGDEVDAIEFKMRWG